MIAIYDNTRTALLLCCGKHIFHMKNAFLSQGHYLSAWSKHCR